MGRELDYLFCLTDLSHGTLCSLDEVFEQRFVLQLLFPVSELYRRAQPESSFKGCLCWNGFVQRRILTREVLPMSLNSNKNDPCQQLSIQQKKSYVSKFLQS